jgi:hypothetical protein
MRTFPALLTGLLGCFLLSLPGCAYTTGSVISSRYQTIFVQPFANNIDYLNQDQRKIYIPGLETKIRNAVVDRFIFDGNLKIADQAGADLVLQGQVLSFERGDLRLTDDEDVKEYRLTVTLALTLWDPVNEKVVWQEPAFSGDTTYYVSGALAKSEESAIADALVDVARRVVARTIEDW